MTPAIGIEFPGRSHEAQIAFPDEIHQRDAAILELLGDRDDEAHVVAGQLLLGVHVASERPARYGHLLRHLSRGIRLISWR